MIDSGEALDVDVVLSLTILMASHKVAGSLLAPTAAIQPQHHGASLKSEPQ